MTDQARIDRLQKTIEDKDQAILLLNELLDETDRENAELKQQLNTLETSEPEHPLEDYRPSMPWTSQEELQ